MSAVRLFMRTLEVMSAALAAHEDDPAYEALRSLVRERAQGRRVGVRFHDESRPRMRDQCTMTFHDGEFELLAHGDDGPERAWHVTRDYLQHVVDEPKRYIDRPELLDWTWLQLPMGHDASASSS